MINKVLKIFGIIVIGIGFFGSFPVASHAQYYYNTNYTPLSVATTTAVNVGSSNAVLNAEINGSNMYSAYNVTTWFEYGKGINLEYKTMQIPSNSGYATFTRAVEGLSPNTNYYFRAVAQGPQGIVYGNTNSFRTNIAVAAPEYTYASTAQGFAAVTETARTISGTSVELNSLIYNEANGFSQTWFEWGADTNLVNKTDTVNTGIFPAVKHKNTLKGLTPGKAYYFRAVSQNSNLINRGAILSFVTSQTTSAVSSSKKSPDTTSTPEIIPVSSINTDLSSILGASVIGGAGAFLPTNLFGWVVLVILALLLILLFKHLLLSFSKKEHRVEHAPAAEHSSNHTPPAHV